MRNVRLEIEYDGSQFYGWEIQPNKRTVRGEIEHKLSEVLQEKIKLTGAARTDAGVHAISQVANFITKSNLTISTIRRALLGLPKDIYIKDVSSVPLEFNARHDAISRTYLYRLLLDRSPLLRTKVWEYKYNLDIQKMKRALPLFIGRHKFDLFSHKDTGECEVQRFILTQSALCEQGEHIGASLLIFEIEANRFLHKMVRMIIGALTELGRGKIDEKTIKLALQSSSNQSPFNHSPVCAAAHGLYLKEIKYGFKI